MSNTVLEALGEVRNKLQNEMADLDRAIGLFAAGSPMAQSSDANPPALVDYMEVPSDGTEFEYHINVYADNSASCTCPSYVRGNRTCKHITRFGFSRRDGVTTPPKADLPWRP